MARRRQLSLYVPEHAAAQIEAVRRVLDPVQQALIPAHVTLCRDDELDAVSASALMRASSITLVFGAALAFDGHGILLPYVAGEGDFAQLRADLLDGQARQQKPHITLAHPRNPRARGNSLDLALTLPPEISISFGEIALIEQALGEPWRVLKRYLLGA